MLKRCILNNSYSKTKYLKLLTKDATQTRIPLRMVTTMNSCICFQNNPNIYIRLHSSVSDSRRQKVILDTTDPKIVLEKVPIIEKVLPDRKIPEKYSFLNQVDAFRGKADPYMKLIRLDKPIGTWLLFWPCSWSIGLASVCGAPVPAPEMTLSTLGLFLAGSLVMRGAGCTINDLWDRDIDGRVERTKDRPLVSGAITEKQAIVFLAAQLSVGLAILLQLNWYSVILGASSMLLVVMYPLAKRFTDYPQIFLGATFNWGALLGWSAMQGAVDPVVCLPLYLGALCWTVVYDTIYAHQDKYDDARIGIKSTALRFGKRTKPLLSLWAFGALSGMMTTGVMTGLEWPYYAALGGAAVHIGRQIYTLDTENPSDCADKFKSNSLVGLIIFLGIAGGGWKKYSESRRKEKENENS